MNGESYEIGKNTGEIFNHQVISARNVPASDGHYIKDETLESKLYNGDKLLSVNLPLTALESIYTDPAALEILLFTDLKDKEGNSYYWYYDDQIALFRLASTSEDRANMLKNDSNGFPASYQLHLDIPTCDNSNGTMDITYYDHADFIWNADTGVVRCSTSEIKGVFALSFKTYVDLSEPLTIKLSTKPCE